jgi:hypothetical protein
MAAKVRRTSRAMRSFLGVTKVVIISAMAISDEQQRRLREHKQSACGVRRRVREILGWL